MKIYIPLKDFKFTISDCISKLSFIFSDSNTKMDLVIQKLHIFHPRHYEDILKLMAILNLLM